MSNRPSGCVAALVHSVSRRPGRLNRRRPTRSTRQTERSQRGLRSAYVSWRAAEDSGSGIIYTGQHNGGQPANYYDIVLLRETGQPKVERL